jgi:hypothetical protein
MPLRKRLKKFANATATAGKAEGKQSKRQRLLDFIKHRKHKGGGEEQASTVRSPALSPATITSTPMLMAFRSKIPVRITKQTNSLKPEADSKTIETPKPTRLDSSVKPTTASTEKEEEKDEQTQTQVQLPTPPPEVQQPAEVPPLSEEHLHKLFSGAPHFAVDRNDGRSYPRASFPWDTDLATKDVSDSMQFAHPAFSAATLRRHLPALPQSSDQDKQYLSYDIGVVELPSMLSAQGIEPGTIGFVHFLELPISDTLLADPQQSQSSNDYLDSARNKEQMQTNPERLGIRKVDCTMLYDRLLEIGDLIEVFQDSPEKMTILNNQSSGDLYANLFGKFLTPPAYDDTADDPTGMKVQIDTLLKILRLKGVWYDFSLVVWRIRLGQILWSDPVSDTLNEPHLGELWSEREILLLQITLACELLLRLDAVTSLKVEEVKGDMHVNRDDYLGFLKLKTRKVDWDLVLARRFLDNIVVMKQNVGGVPAQNRSRGLLSMLSRDEPKAAPTPDFVLLPRHQARQLAGLVCFAETLRWPGLKVLAEELAKRLGASDSSDYAEHAAASYKKYLEPSITSAVSVYGTPLATPRSITSTRDSYFGHVSRPAVERSNSQLLTVPLTTTLVSPVADATANTMSVGGWLSRSYLTGLILPGEAISHFLMSTLLENDTAAMTALGDSAELYGGFVYSDRSWWSKHCIVGRVIACMEGAVECMGWISIPKIPETLPDGWYAISSQQLPHADHPRITSANDPVFRDSAFVPRGDVSNVKPEDLVLPMDPSTPPIPSIVLSDWSLTATTPETPEAPESEVSSQPSQTESYTATLTFAFLSRGTPHAFNLTHDVHFVTSFPCTPPSKKSPGASAPEILKSSLSRSSSKLSIHSAKSGSKRLSRLSSRRSSHGFEPLLSHPPDSPSITPTRIYSPVPETELAGDTDTITAPRSEPLMSHPLHASYKYKIVPVTDVLDPNFSLPFKNSSALISSSRKQNEGEDNTILVLDARSARDLELFARAWCAEKGLHALIGRTSRTCLACCIREARGLGLNIVIRV